MIANPLLTYKKKRMITNSPCLCFLIAPRTLRGPLSHCFVNFPFSAQFVLQCHFDCEGTPARVYKGSVYPNMVYCLILFHGRIMRFVTGLYLCGTQDSRLPGTPSVHSDVYRIYQHDPGYRRRLILCGVFPRSPSFSSIVVRVGYRMDCVTQI